MIKNISTLLILLCSVFSFSQNAILLKNTNPKAKELHHALNATKDSLILRCSSALTKVDIFNEEYDSSVIVNTRNTKVPLNDLPSGKFVIEVQLPDKIISMNLVKRGNERPLSAFKSEPIAEGMGMMLDENLKIVKASPHKSIEFLLTRTKKSPQAPKAKKYFWIESLTVNEVGSSKTMKLADQQLVDKLILKHQLEIKCYTGKQNTLTVWEVYNTRKFIEHQMTNSNFVYSQSTEVFNPTPYYKTRTKSINL